MASIEKISIEVNAELERICLESKEIIEGFHKLLGVHTSTEALAKIAVLMREDDTADRLLSKALGHLHSCPELGSNDLYQEIAAAFGEAVEHSVQPTVLTARHKVDGRKNSNRVTLICPECHRQVHSGKRVLKSDTKIFEAR